MSRFIKGMDLSTLLEMERCGAKYYDHGTEMDVLEIMKDRRYHPFKAVERSEIRDGRALRRR